MAGLSAEVCAATQSVTGQRMKSLRECHFSRKGRLHSTDLKLMRHMSADQLRRRVEVSVAELRGERVERHSIEDADASSAENQSTPEAVNPPIAAAPVGGTTDALTQPPSLPKLCIRLLQHRLTTGLMSRWISMRYGTAGSFDEIIERLFVGILRLPMSVQDAGIHRRRCPWCSRTKLT